MPFHRVTGAAIVAVLIAAAGVEAQFGRGRFNVRLATSEDYDGGFHFCRAWFRSAMGGDGGNWSVDFPRADINLSIRLAELTKTPVSERGELQPNHLLVRLTDDMLFQCPFVMMTEVGSLYFDEREAARLREYLLKGGFLWVDDFWGSYAWGVWASQIRKVFPSGEYPIVDLPPDHAIYRTQFVVAHTPQLKPRRAISAMANASRFRSAGSMPPGLPGDRLRSLLLRMNASTRSVAASANLPAAR